MRKVALGALVLAPLAAMGCTALLGDFEVLEGSGGGTEAGSSDGPGTGDGPTDGPSTTDAGDPDAFDAQSLVFTTCGINETSIRTIEEVTTEGGVAYTGQLQIFRINQNTVRVIAQKNAGDGATVYSFDPKNGSGPITPTVINLQSAGRWLDTRRLPSQGILSLLFLERFAGAPLAHMKAVELPDSDLNAQQSINLSQNFTDRLSFGGGNVSGALGAYQNNNEYFWAMGGWPGPPDSGTYELLVGYRPSAQSIPTPVLAHSTTDDRLVRVREMARSQQTQYLFNDKGPDSPQDEGSSYFAIPQTTTTAVPAKQLRPAGGTKPFVMFGASGINTGDGIRLAVAEVDFNSTNFGQVRAGVVSQADLSAGFDGTKVPSAFTLTSLTEVPSESEARFFAADMLWLGTPPDPLRGQGLNFIWYDTDRRVMRSKQTGMQRLLANHMAIERSSVWLEAQTAVTADADVVFMERRTSNTWLLQYARLSCIR